MSRQQISTEAIILTRIDYGEADRILTVLTPDQGKLSLMARGVRRVKSKLAGGIELFSVSHITFVRGRGELGSLASSRLKTHYANITADLDRTMLGYDLIKLLHKNTEDHTEPEYFELLKNALNALNKTNIPPEIVRMWFVCQLLNLAGHAPNLQTDITGQALSADKKYSFDTEDMSFVAKDSGKFGSAEIKMLRLAHSQNSAEILAMVRGGGELAGSLAPLVDTMLRFHLRV